MTAWCVRGWRMRTDTGGRGRACWQEFLLCCGQLMLRGVPTCLWRDRTLGASVVRPRFRDRLLGRQRDAHNGVGSSHARLLVRAVRVSVRARGSAGFLDGARHVQPRTCGPADGRGRAKGGCRSPRGRTAAGAGRAGQSGAGGGHGRAPAKRAVRACAPLRWGVAGMVGQSGPLTDPRRWCAGNALSVPRRSGGGGWGTPDAGGRVPVDGAGSPRPGPDREPGSGPWCSAARPAPRCSTATTPNAVQWPG